MGSPAFSISKAELVTVFKGLGIALAGAALTYFSQFISHTDFGMYTPLIVAGWSFVTNFCIKFGINTQTTPTV